MVLLQAQIFGLAETRPILFYRYRHGAPFVNTKYFSLQALSKRDATVSRLPELHCILV